MNIALLGYGKMGKMLEKIGIGRGHTILAKIDVGTDRNTIDPSMVDVAIDFSTPDAAFDNIKWCLDHQIPVISGTTGWLHHFDKAVAYCESKGGAFIYASNFSLGVNLFFELNRKLAKMMQKQDGYRISMEETHHIHKLDAPSGTAISLAEGIMDHSKYTEWKLDQGKETQLPITAKREAEVPGTHSVTYHSKVDDIEIKHTAHNREGFALGAIVAGEWIQGKKGVFTMKDVLNLS